jgi:hypothetical protein
MDIPNVPKTATEKYYERLAENIKQRIQETKSRRDKERLELMLEEVRERMQNLHQESEPEPESAFPEESDELLLTEVIEEGSEKLSDQSLSQAQGTQPGPDQTSGEESDELLLTEVIEEGGEEPSVSQLQPGQVSEEESDVLALTDIIEEVSEETVEEDETLTEKEREIVKERLKGILERFQGRRHEFPQKQADLILTDVMQEITEEAPLAETDLLPEEQEKIKDRLKFILEAFKAETQEVSQEAGEELLLTEEIPLDEIDLLKGDRKAVRLHHEDVSAQIQGIGQEIQPVSSDEAFAEICEKVGNGEPLALLSTISLSERERELVNAFLGHLSSYKGVKKQQAFEMQHLTARSIRELDLIFKTYYIDGYLKAELHNIYNRLLNLRSRFSVLLH